MPGVSSSKKSRRTRRKLHETNGSANLLLGFSFFRFTLEKVILSNGMVTCHASNFAPRCNLPKFNAADQLLGDRWVDWDRQ